MIWLREDPFSLIVKTYYYSIPFHNPVHVPFYGLETPDIEVVLSE